MAVQRRGVRTRALGAVLPGAGVAVLLAGVVLSAGPLRYPTLNNNQIRIEGHLMPAVSTGPLDPAWSPDGRWIAFSAKGDIWKVPAAGGEPIALTQGPAYHFEPAWSRDGTQIALSMDADGNLDIGVVSADGGAVRRLTTDPHVDVQPVWSLDGTSVYFVTGRKRSLDIYRVAVATGAESAVVDEPGDQIQPAVSPDGRTLAYVSPVQGRVGDGGIWVRPLEAGTARLVHFEETSLRTKPVWTPDGRAFVYVSDVTGPNHIAAVPADGGNPVLWTTGATDEYAPAVSPDGSTVAFVSNRRGPTELFTMSVGGAHESQWAAVPLRRLRARTPRGTVRVTVVGPDGRPTPARIQGVAADGRAYAPDGGFHRVNSATETHYFHTDGSFELRVPPGPLAIEALKGFEYKVAKTSIDVAAGGTVEAKLALQRLVDMPAQGWYSGDTHIHDLHQGRYGLTHRDLVRQLVAEDIRVANSLIHMDGTKLMGRWSDLTGALHPLSTPDYLLRYGEEYRGARGHVGLVGIKHYILPFIGGVPGTVHSAERFEGAYIEAARKQGGIGGFLHPYNVRAKQPKDSANSEIPIAAALGQGDFYDIASIPSDEFASAEMYYRFLNVGLRLPATGGSDNFSNVWRDAPPGTGRTYARLSGPLTFESWIAAVKAGRTFGTNGPLLSLDVDGNGPGDEIRLEGNKQAAVTARATATSLSPLDALDIVANGAVVHTQRPAKDATQITATATVPLPRGGWVAARVHGPNHRYNSDTYAFAQTTPVFVLRDGERFTSAEDAKFLVALTDEFWKRVDAQNRFDTPAAKEAYRAEVQRARAFYQRAAASPSAARP